MLSDQVRVVGELGQVADRYGDASHGGWQQVGEIAGKVPVAHVMMVPQQPDPCISSHPHPHSCGTPT